MPTLDEGFHDRSVCSLHELIGDSSLRVLVG